MISTMRGFLLSLSIVTLPGLASAQVGERTPLRVPLARPEPRTSTLVRPGPRPR